MYKERYVILIMLLIFQLLCVLPSAILCPVPSAILCPVPSAILCAVPSAILCAVPSAILPSAILPSAIMSANAGLRGATGVITAYLLRKGPVRPFGLQIFLKKNSDNKWSGIQTTYDSTHDHVLLTMLTHLNNNNIKDIKGAVLIKSKQCLIQLTNEEKDPQISDTKWFNIHKVPQDGSAIPGKETLCSATQELIRLRESRLHISGNDLFRMFDG